METLNKNTEVVGVSDALKSLACKSLTKHNQVDDSNCDLPLTDNKITINPSPSIDENLNGDNEKIMNDYEDEIQNTCGWCDFKPTCLKKFINPKWMLLFLCLAGIVQGKKYSNTTYFQRSGVIGDV